MSDASHPDLNRTGEFVDLLTSHQIKLLGYIMALVPRADDAKNIMQEVPKTLWENFSSFEPETNFLAWAKKIAFHRILEYRREYRRRAGRGGLSFPDDVLERIAARWDEAPASSSDRHDALRHCMEKLRAEDRRIVERRYHEGCSVQEIADQVGRPVNSVSKSLQRIRRTLLECIQREMKSNE